MVDNSKLSTFLLWPIDWSMFKIHHHHMWLHTKFDQSINLFLRSSTSWLPIILLTLLHGWIHNVYLYFTLTHNKYLTVLLGPIISVYCCIRTTTGTANKAGNVYPSGTSSFTPGLHLVQDHCLLVLFFSRNI